MMAKWHRPLSIRHRWGGAIIGALLFAGCQAPPVSTPPDQTPTNPAAETAEVEAPAVAPESGDTDGAVATVEQVEVTGSEQAYTVAVTLASPDTGCDQYADWWEVVTPEGDLIYRRILVHSHVDEQPFTRSGGPVAIAADQTLIVRGHMHPSGYGDQAMTGSVAEGFTTTTVAPDFAQDLTLAPPLPEDCTF
jgi:hypothetical protein